MTGTGSPPTGSALGAADAPLADLHDVALLDLDGVLYVGGDAVPHAAASLAAARRRGMRAAYVTNNASRSPATVAAHLRELDIDARDCDVVTSAQAAARVLAERLAPGSRVLVVGTDALAAEVTARGLTAVRSADERPDAVVQGFDPELRWADLAEAAYALAAGALWVASNTDTSVPTPRGRAPGNGALVAALATATGLTPVVAGKPEPALHRESVDRTGATRPLVVGDRLDTDILGAARADCASLLVLTGVVAVPELLAAPAGLRPTHVGPDLRALLLAQPRVDAVEPGWSCDGWHVTVAGSRWEVRAGSGPVAVAPDPGDPDAPDAGERAVREEVAVLRALCAAAWSGPGEQPRVAAPADGAAEAVLARLGL